MNKALLSLNEPQPRTDPLIIDRIAGKSLPHVRTYIERHGGNWHALADGGFLVSFPAGTVQWLTHEDEEHMAYMIEFPDTALLIWCRFGSISTRGLPRGIHCAVSVPEV